MSDDQAISDILDQFEANYEIDRDMNTLRVEMQKKSYEVLCLLLENAKIAAVNAPHLNRRAMDAALYGNSSDLAKAQTALSKTITTGFESLFKFFGSPDTPTQLAVASSQKKDSQRSTVFQNFTPANREKIRQVYTAFLVDAKDAEIVQEPVKIPMTPEPDDNLRLFPELFIDPE